MSSHHFLDYNSEMNSRARQLRREMTRQEKKLWYDFLRLYPVKFYRQRVIESFIVDFYCPSAKLVVELDGSQHYEEEAASYDAWRTSVLESHGLQVIRFSNDSVNTNFRGVCAGIDHAVKEIIDPADCAHRLPKKWRL